MSNYWLVLFGMVRKKYKRNWIKEMRTSRGLTVAELAGRVRVSGPYITYLENSQRRLYHDVAEKIAKALECHVLDITDGPESAAPKNEAEKKLIKDFRGLSDSAKGLFVHMIETYKKEKK